MTAVEAIRSSKAAALAAPVAVGGFLSLHSTTAGPTICPFALLTGHACPLCGGTRAAAALAHGDVAGAWSLHPLIFVIVPLALIAWAKWLGRGRPWAAPLTAHRSNQLLAGLGVAFLAVWVLRLATGTLPPV
jgi:hypothetical protein